MHHTPRDDQQGSRSNIPAAPRLPPRNPLLSLAEGPFNLEDIAPVRLVPVTPATPAVLQDEPEPATEPDSFLNQYQQPKLPSAPTSSSYAPPQVPPQVQPPSPQQQQQQQPKQQQHGYFTSILSSLPSLSLITGQEDSRPRHSPVPSNPSPVYGVQQQQQPQQPVQQQFGGYGAPPIVSSFNAGAQGPPPLQQQQQQPFQPPPLQAPPTQPPPAFPPTGGAAGSYRLGNQRRLKYAPPPDLTSTTSQQQFQPPPSVFPVQSSNVQSSVPPTFFNPNAQPVPNASQPSPFTNQPAPTLAHSSPYTQPSSIAQPSLYAQSNPLTAATAPVTTTTAPPSGTPSSQGSSIHSSFRTSPVTTSTISYGYAVPPPQTSSNSSFGGGSAQSQPQAIPSRLLEPATPQNTPADVAFSGFSAYRQQQQQQQQQQQEPSPFVVYGSESSSRPPPQLEAIQEGHTGASGSEKTFSPISAAKVTEKLENLIAAEQNDDTLSVKSELSAEVAKITAGIPEPRRESVPVLEEQLTEIDLNASGNSDSLSLQQVSDNDNTSFEELQQKPPKKNDFQVNFFGTSDVEEQQPSAPVFYNPSLQAQQPIADPFSFVQSSVPPPNNPPSAAADTTKKETPEPPKSLNFGDKVDLAPSSIWGNDSQTQQSQPSILNPSAFGASNQHSVHQQHQEQQQQVAQQQAPTFFNPAQFAQPTSAFRVPSPASSSSVSHVPSAAGAFSQHNSYNSNTSGSSSNQQAPPPLYNNKPSHESHFNAVPEPTGSATLNPEQMSVSPLTSRTPQETVPPSLENLASGLPEKQMQYRPVYHHWFYRREVESKTLWLPFSMHDSLNIEEVHNSNEISPETKVATDGGRFDVEILRRSRAPVYWTGPTTEVRRCSWFYKGPAESRYTPYEENVAARLEEEFKQACMTNNWNRRVELSNGEYIIFHSSSVQVHYLQATTPELAASWGNNSGATSRPRIVKRGMDEFNIDEGEPEKVDHLLFLIHGIGSVCDLKFRSVEEVVDEFRSIALQLVQSHYRSSSEQGIVNRIEVLPVSWHATLHSGIDKKLQNITLESIPKWRHFTNDTLLDILFYTSPVYCETIMRTVGTELNRLYALFNQRNSDFCGNVYLGGHSLGSLIVFDLLCHQRPPEEDDDEQPESNGRNDDSHENREDSPVMKPLPARVQRRKLSKKISYVMGAAGTGQPYINYPQLAFSPRAFFALGSPIGMFVTVRGIDNLGEDFVLPTCPAFFNIFHPFDPVAYRIESLVNSEAHKYRPMLIPHHKGRKRMHLELKETMARVGADLKQRLLESVRNTWNSVYQLAMFHKQDNQTLEQEIEKVVEEQMNNPCSKTMSDANHEDSGAEVKIGKLNGGRRIDYVLQEAPFEYINEYIFAMTSHVCYWESEDTMLLILKEIYGSMGIQTDAQLPQQSLSIERVATPTMSAGSSYVSSPTQAYGMDPTAPISSKPVGPPPTAGFVKKS